MRDYDDGVLGLKMQERPPMREWLLMSGPVAIVAYFLIFPDQFDAFVAWAIGLIN